MTRAHKVTVQHHVSWIPASTLTGRLRSYQHREHGSQLPAHAAMLDRRPKHDRCISGPDQVSLSMVSASNQPRRHQFAFLEQDQILAAATCRDQICPDMRPWWNLLCLSRPCIFCVISSLHTLPALFKAGEGLLAVVALCTGESYPP